MNAITPELQLAIAHGIFNIVTTIVFFPFINKIVIVIQKIFPSRHHELQMDLSELDPNVVQLFPCHALAIAKNKIIEMGNLAVTMMKTIRMYFEDKNGTTKENIEELEGAINLLDKKITDYLLLISHEQLNDHDSNDYFANMKSIKDIERIGDICMNLAHFFEAIFDQKEDFSEEGKQDILTMLDMDIDTLQHSLQAFDQHDVDDVVYVDEQESQIDFFNKKAKQRHIERVSNRLEKSELVQSTYIDILSNLERISDHCTNIAEAYLLDDSIFRPDFESPKKRKTF